MLSDLDNNGGEGGWLVAGWLVDWLDWLAPGCRMDEGARCSMLQNAILSRQGVA